MQGGKRTIRAYQDSDEASVVDIWFRSGKQAYPYLDAWRRMTPETAQVIFRKAILDKSNIWVAVSRLRLAGFSALQGSLIDRLYVDPNCQREGWGKLLLDHAKSLSPDGLKLFTHQENITGCAFYEKEGFQAVAFSTSPPPESAPDVEYRWELGYQNSDI